jgi:hypothetical protein
MSGLRRVRLPAAAGVGRRRWFDHGELAAHVERDRDLRQLAGLSPEATDRFLDAAGVALESLGYRSR